MARVAVVIPVHNGALYLMETLRAVAAQTQRCHEIVVVDDGSTDGSADLANASGIATRVISQSQGGVSRARNQGLAVTDSEFVCFLDQDDVWHPQHLQRQLACFDQHPEVAVVVSPYHHWYAAAGEFVRPQGLNANEELAIDPDFTGWVYHQFLLDCWALTSATMLRCEALARYGAFNEALPFSEDWDLWLRLSRDVKFAKLNGPAVLYRQHEKQGTRKARAVDYRCKLLLETAQLHGLVSRDGRCIGTRQFETTIARYQTEFGYEQLRQGDQGIGVRALWSAWCRHPTSIRSLAFAVAGSLGWRPRMSGPTVASGLGP